MVYDIASPYFGVRKCWGGDTFALPGGVFFKSTVFSWCFFFVRNDTEVLWELDESIR